jgi:hypothetical protein
MGKTMTVLAHAGAQSRAVESVFATILVIVGLALKQRAALDQRLQAEGARWEKQKEKLDAALSRARE